MDHRLPGKIHSPDCYRQRENHRSGKAEVAFRYKDTQDEKNSS